MDSIQSQIRAKSFVTELNESSMIYEVKRTRAVFDDSLAIPGTNRRGGWRCPPGTRYGGQITDRFGRNCGWGVSRRLANEISDLGERLENIGDRRRSRRAARAERAAGRVRKPGLVERAAGNVARALDTNETVDAPKPSRARRGAGRIEKPRRGNLRDSELRRMDREIDNPGAPRTGDIENPPARRPRPPAPAARRRPAAQQVAREKPKPEVVDAPEAPAPAKKAPAKKAAAKKKAAKKKAPAKKAPARRVTTAAGGNDEPPKMSAKPQAEAKQPAVKVGDDPLSEENLRDLADMNAGAFDLHKEEINAGKRGIDDDMQVWSQENVGELEGMANRQDAYVEELRRNLQRAVDRLRSDGPDADDEELRALKANVISQDYEYAVGIHRRSALKNRLAELRGDKNPKTAEKKRYIDAGEFLGVPGYRAMDFENAPDGYNRAYNDAMINRAASVEQADNIARDIQNNLTQVNDWIEKLNNLEDKNNILIAFRDGDIEVADLRRNFEEMRSTLQERLDKVQKRKAQIIKNPSDSQDQPDWEKFGRLDVGLGIDWNELDAVLGDLYRDESWALTPKERNKKLQDDQEQLKEAVDALTWPRETVVGVADRYDREKAQYQGDLREAMLRFENEPDAAERKKIAREIYIINAALKDSVMRRDIYANRAAEMLNNPQLPDKPESAVDIIGDKKALDDVKKRVADAVDGNKKDFGDYLNKVYGEGNAPWKEMNREKLIDLFEKAKQNEPVELAEILNWAKSIYNHDLIEGKNGKKYQIDIDGTRIYGDNIYISGNIYHIDENGNRELVGTTSRTLFMGNSNPDEWYVENNYMKIEAEAHKGAGIQNIYNQHAFMYLKAAGFNRVYLGAAWDGKYVWGRVGFRQPINRNAINILRGEISKFKDGRSSLIKNEDEARRINALMKQLQEWYELPAARRPERQPVRHMDFVYALDMPAGRGKKTRQKELREWFIDNIPFDSGNYYFDENGITEDPRK